MNNFKDTKMRTTIAVMLTLCAISLQGCFISINSGNPKSDKSKCVNESAVKTTLGAIASLPSEEAKIAALSALAQTPMNEDDHIALIKAIETVNNSQARQDLLITSINTRRDAKAGEKPKKTCQ